MYQHRDVGETEKRLRQDFENNCDWFVDNKLSVDFREDKTKPIVFLSKRKINSARKLNVKNKDIKIKQHSQVTYPGCVLDEPLSEEPMALTLFRIGGWGGGRQKGPLTSFSHLTSTNVGISPQNFLTFSFNAFSTLV